MSPSEAVGVVGDVGFPRVSGDEPCWRRASTVLVVFSPRERG